MEEFDKIVKEFEAVTKKLKAWFDYYKDEDLFKNLDRDSNTNIGRCLKEQIEHLQVDAMLLSIASSIIKMDQVARMMREHL